jgi:pantoate--beta-alanine ligase
VLTCKFIAEIAAFIEAQKALGKTVGFVPTMGALHLGHMSLIEISKQHCDVTVCSIFVNPTQFNDKNDLLRYPKTPEKDLEMLKNAGCDVAFMPEVEEMYAKKDEASNKQNFDFGDLDKILEGARRPGHFNGVAQVVSKLFEIVKPNKSFFGSKDYQQVMIVKNLIKQLNFSVEIIACPILRESDGLAMSSRNMLLSIEERDAAAIIPKLMAFIKIKFEAGLSVVELKLIADVTFKQNSIYKLDYFEICDADSLEIISHFSEAKKFVTLIACFVGKVRLIDNLVF